MKNTLLMLLFSALLFVTGSAFAFTPPTPTGYVTDTTGKLSPSQVSQLNHKLTDYQRRTQNEVAVLLIPTLGGENVDDVTHQVFKTYGVGKAGLDNGVLFLLAVNDHKMRLQTGKGVEGDLPDIQTKQMQDSIRSYLRSGDFYGGVNSLTDQIISTLDSRAGQKAQAFQLKGTTPGQQFNKPIPADPQPTQDTTATAKSNGCSVGGDVGNVAGWSFGLLALIVAAIAFTRRYVRNRETQKMKDIEDQVNAEMAAEEAEKVRAFEAAKAETERAAREALAAEQRAKLEAARASVTPPAPAHWGGALPPVTKPVATKVTAPRMTVPAPIPVRVDEVPVRLPQHDVAALAALEAARHLEEQKAQARRERIREEERAEARRREREAEEEAAAAIAAAAVVSVFSSSDDSSDSDSSSSDSGFSWGGSDSSDSDSGGSDSGFGGGDSGGGGSDSDW